LKIVEFDSEFDETVLHFLRKNYSKNFSKGWRYGRGTIAIFVHEEYVWRTSSNQTITVVFEPTDMNERSKVTILSSGGGSGFLGFDWGSESAAENTLAKKIKEITSSRY
jgi:hypothetical protein